MRKVGARHGTLRGTLTGAAFDRNVAMMGDRLNLGVHKAVDHLATRPPSRA
jgi:hypothetical protein